MADDEELDAETAIDSADLENFSENSLGDEDEGIDHMSDFDESTDRNSVMVMSSSSSHLSMVNSNPISTSASDSYRPRRVFIDLPAVQ